MIGDLIVATRYCHGYSHVVMKPGVFPGHSSHCHNDNNCPFPRGCVPLIICLSVSVCVCVCVWLSVWVSSCVLV